MGSSLATPSQNMVKELSRLLSEPGEISQLRANALDLFTKLPLEKSPLYSKYVDMVSGLNLDSIEPGRPTSSRELPREISHLVKARDEPTLALQVDSQMVRTEVHGTLEKEGIVFTDIENAVAKYPDLARPHLSKAIPPDDDKFAALNTAFFTGGTFLFVPKGLSIKIPFRNIVLLKSRGMGSFTRNIIVAEENTKVTFLQEAYSKLEPGKQETALYSETTEVYAGEGAEVNFASVQNFENNVHSLINRRSIVGRDARMNWTIGHIGGGITRSRVDSILNGQGAVAEDVEVVFGAEAQRFDVVTDLTHEAPNTTGHVLARGVLRDSARSIFKGMIRIEPGAKNSNSYLAEHAMILSKKARADAIPGLEINTNEVKATHSGSVSQIDEEQVFYLMARGLTQSEAQRLIIIGFLHPAVQRIPLRTVRAAIQYLIDEKWVGRGGQIPPKADSLPEYEEEPEAETVSADLFERHYKYR
jgi:FeS assembly protein SufD